MAEEQDDSDKTEEPTARRLEEARRKGDAPKSADVAAFAGLLVAALAIGLMAGPFSRTLALDMTVFLDQSHALPADGGGLIGLYARTLAELGLGVVFVLVALAAGGVLGHVVQTGLLFAGEKLQPKMEKLNPIDGAKRLFGKEGLINLAKSLVKAVVLGAAAWWAFQPLIGEITESPRLAFDALPAALLYWTGRVGLGMLIAVGVLAVLDWVIARQMFMDRLKMSRQQIKEELRETEGDPHLRARLRQIRMERGRRRMMSQVPTATVVITNPTHYAVALRYVKGEDAAPVCVAKGVDRIALRIRAVAEDAGVAVVAEPALARALYASVDIDATIPSEHYQAVARIVGYVMKVAAGRAARAS